jgi:hypothetical protein
MRRTPTPALLAALLPLASLHCSDPERGDSALLDQLERIWAPSGQEQEQLTPPSNCRSVASQRGVRSAGSSGQSSCQFDAETSELECRTALGQRGEISTSEFASLHDFVEAAHSLGKVTSLREVRGQGDQALVTSHDYDELGRLIRSRENRDQGEFVYGFSNFDAAGRPRTAQPSRATLATWGCEAAAYSIEYDDPARRVRQQYEASARCDTPAYSIVQRYDALGSLVQTQRESAEGIETLFEAGAPTTTATICE